MNEFSYDAQRPESVRDLGQAISAQQAAGPAATEALAQGFLARVQRDIDEQVDLRIQQRLASGKPARSSAGDMSGIVIASLIVGAIITVAKTSDLGVGGIAIVWAAIVVVNMAWAVGMALRH